MGREEIPSFSYVACATIHPIYVKHPNDLAYSSWIFKPRLSLRKNVPATCYLLPRVTSLPPMVTSYRTVRQTDFRLDVTHFPLIHSNGQNGLLFNLTEILFANPSFLCLGHLPILCVSVCLCVCVSVVLCVCVSVCHFVCLSVILSVFVDW